MTQPTRTHQHTFLQDFPPGLHYCDCGQYALAVMVDITGEGDMEEGLQLIDDPSEMATHPFYRED